MRATCPAHLQCVRSSPNIIEGKKKSRKINGRKCNIYGRERNAYVILVGKFEKLIPHGRFKYSWDSFINMILKDI
jgi:hypothetical protein